MTEVQFGRYENKNKIKQMAEVQFGRNENKNKIKQMAIKTFFLK